MTPVKSADLDQASQYFDRSLNRVAEVTTGLTDPQWRFKPAPDRWSIAEIMEHMVVVQERVLGPIREQLAHAPAPPADRDHQQVDAIIIEKIPDRSLKAKAPEFIAPSGQLKREEALERLFRNYQRLVEFVESTPDLREHAVEAPPIRFVTNGAFTTLDGYQWALTVALHDERHVRQILEVQADPNYPRNA